MAKPESRPDRSDALNRRDVLRLGVASLGAPLLAASTPAVCADDRPAQDVGEPGPLSDFPIWEGEDYPGHPDPRQERQQPQVHRPGHPQLRCRQRRPDAGGRDQQGG